MELEFLGTGAGVPSKGRNVSSLALRLLDERNEIWLFDVGEGTQHQILSTTLRPRKITKIFITHLHGDHIYGLPGLLASRSFQAGERPLDIYGPVGLKKYIMTSLAVTGTHLPYTLNIHEIKNESVIFQDQHMTVSCAHLDHRVECFGYRVVENDLPGELMADKIKAIGVPFGPLYGKLKAGQTIEFNGQLIKGSDFIGPEHPGRIVTILGDTRKTSASIKLAQQADVLVHESTFGQSEAGLAKAYYHSTSAQAAQVAQAAGVKRLLLNHISARYLGRGASKLAHQAQTIFSATQVVNDFDIVEVPVKKGVDQHATALSD